MRLLPSVCMSACLSTCLSACAYVCLPVCMCVMSIRICMYTCLPLRVSHFSSRRSVIRSVSGSLNQIICLPAFLSYWLAFYSAAAASAAAAAASAAELAWRGRLLGWVAWRHLSPAPKRSEEEVEDEAEVECVRLDNHCMVWTGILFSG